MTSAILEENQSQVVVMHQPVSQLLNRIQSGDEDALLALHDQFADAVYAVTYRVLGNSQDAEESAQDTFLRVWEQAAQYDPERGAFVSWLLTIARHIAIDRLRLRQRRQPDSALAMDANPHLWETQILDDSQRDVARTLALTLHELPVEQRAVLELAYFQGMSHSDIAAHLGRPLGTVKSQIRLGMEKLRAIWMEQRPATDDEL